MLAYEWLYFNHVLKYLNSKANALSKEALELLVGSFGIKKLWMERNMNQWISTFDFFKWLWTASIDVVYFFFRIVYAMFCIGEQFLYMKV